MLVSDYILKFLTEKKVKDVFLLTGGAITFVVDAFSRNKNIKYTCVAHEQAAAMMADAYSRIGPNFSATMCTSGPGATNLITGIACSWFDSIPSLHICGQVNRYEMITGHPSTKKVRQVGFQETDIVSIAKPITKFAYQIKNEKEVRYCLEKAFYISQTGRPGPVLLDIPMDIQRKKISPNSLKKFIPKKERIDFKLLDNKIKLISKLLNKSKRPTIIVGGGIRISKTEKNLKSLLNKLNIPIVTTWSGLDAVSHEHRNYIGTIGVYGNRAANFTIQNSDFVLSLGSRLDTRITGGVPKTFARGAKIVSVDIDKYELGKKRGLNIKVPINNDLKDFFYRLEKNSKNFSITKKEWIIKALKWKQKYPAVVKSDRKQKKHVNPYFFMEELSKQLKSDDIIVADDGGHLTWAVQGLKIRKNQRLFSAFGNSPMGYALPAAIGASIAKNKKKIICIDGDGSIQINIQELQTIMTYKLPIKLFIINNNGYGIIKQFQGLYLGKRYEASDGQKGVKIPNFAKISKAYGFNYSEIIKNNEIEKTLKKVLKSNKPEFINVYLNPNQKIIPKLSFGDPIEDLSPRLNRNEFYENMIIDPLRKSKPKESL